MRNRSDTASGKDGIRYTILKRLFLRGEARPNCPHTPTLDALSVIVLEFLNAIRERKHFPKDVLQGQLMPLLKDPSKPLDLNYYRPITLQSCLYKIASGIIATRMRSACLQADAISSLQGCGQPLMGVEPKIGLLQNVIHHARREQAPLFLFLADVRKAFDTVPFEAFNFSLKQLGFSDDFIALIDSLQRDTTVVTRTPHGDSAPFVVKRGCKQGCGLSPLRFELFLDLFLKHIAHSDKGYRYTRPSFHTAGGRREPPCTGTSATLNGLVT